MGWFEIVIQIVLILVSVTPLVIALINFVRKCATEKNWKALVKVALHVITEAESKFDNGDDKLDYAISVIKTAAKDIEYEISEEEIKTLINDVIAVTKQVNAIVSVDKSSED